MISINTIYFWDLKVYENSVLRKIFGPKMDEIIRGWRKLHNEELHKSYSSANIIRMMQVRMRWAAQVAHGGGGEEICM
jgi:hypothetical protein